MKKLLDDERLIYKCCQLYYIYEKKQSEIADDLGISRTTVSRLLQIGKNLGIVKIELKNVFGRNYESLERRLEDTFGLKEVVIVNDANIDSEKERAEHISRETLKYLSRILKEKEYVGVSMGYTLYNIISSKEVVDPISCTFIPVVGGAEYRQGHEECHSDIIAKGFAKKFGGKSISFFVPAVFSDKNVMEYFLNEPSVKEVTKLYKKMTTVIAGVGSIDDNNTLLQTGYISKEQLEQYRNDGAVGDCFMKFQDIDGNQSKFSDFNDRVVGLKKEELMKIKNRVAVVSGKRKAKAVIGSLKTNRINVLITDYECVQEIFRILDEESMNA